MTANEFTYWLQGFAELNDGPPSEAQWQSIREHLALVFAKVTPPVRPYQPNQWPQAGTVLLAEGQPLLIC